APQRLLVLLDDDLDRTLQDAGGRAEAVGARGSDCRRFPERSESTWTSGQGHRVRQRGQRVRQRRPAVECLCRTGSTERREGGGSLSAARGAWWHLEVQRRYGGTEILEGQPLRDRPAAGGGARLARRQSLRRDEQPRFARHAL